MSIENPFGNEQSNYLNSPEQSAHQSPDEIESVKESLEDDGGQGIIESATSFEGLLASMEVAFPGDADFASDSEAANAIKEIEKSNDPAVIEENLAKIPNIWVRERAFLLKQVQVGDHVQEDGWLPVNMIADEIERK